MREHERINHLAAIETTPPVKLHSPGVVSQIYERIPDHEAMTPLTAHDAPPFTINKLRFIRPFMLYVHQTSPLFNHSFDSHGRIRRDIFGFVSNVSREITKPSSRPRSGLRGIKYAGNPSDHTTGEK